MKSSLRFFAVATAILMCTPLLSSGSAPSTQVTLERFDGGTKSMTLYVDREGDQLSFKLPANATVEEAKLTMGGVLPPVMRRYAVGAAPTAIAGADLNADGALDLATVNSRSDNVSVLINDGLGRYDRSRALDFMVAPEPLDLVLADLDNNGNVDLAVVNSSDAAVTVRLSKSELFGTYSTYKVGGNPTRILAADLNNDSFLDILVTREQFPVVAILYNKGNGEFNPTVDLSVLAAPKGVAVHDVTGDGLPDIVLASDMKPYGVKIVKNLGGTLFDEGETTLPLSWPPSDMRAGDITGDGRHDLVVTSVQGNITIFPAFAGGFGTPSVIECTKQLAAYLADLNNDGMLDLVTVSRWDSTVRTFISRGGGVLVQDQLFLTGNNPTDLFVGDLDGDGGRDITTVDNMGNTVSVAMNNGRGRFAWFDMYDVGQSDKIVALGDLDQDGSIDVFSSNYAWQSVTIAYNDGKGELTKVSRRPGYMVYSGGSGGSEPFYPVIADFNGDGVNDVEYGEELSYAVIMMFNDGHGVFREDSVAHEMGKNMLQAPAYTTVPVDLNGDGPLDLAITHVNHNYISILINDGTGHFEKRINHSMGTGHSFDMVAEDFNGDKLVDLVTANYGLDLSYEENLTFIRNDGGGNFTNVMNMPLKKGPRSLEFVDLNKDGRRDIIVAFSPKKALSDIVPGEIAVIMATETPMKYKDPVYYTAGIMPARIHAMDVDDDNIMDVVCLNQGTGGSTGSLSVFINKGDGTLQPPIEYPDVPFRHVGFGDLNKDGRQEIVDPVLGTHLAVYRAIYYPVHVVLSGPTGENLEQVQGLSQLQREVNLTSSVVAWMKSHKGGSGNVTYRMNITADRAGMVRISGLKVTYFVEAPPAKNPRTYSEQGMIVMLILLGLLVIVSFSIGAPKTPVAPKRSTRTKPKGKPKKKEEETQEPGPVIVRAPPPIKVEAVKPDWDKGKKKEAVKEKAKPTPKGPPVKVEVMRDGWRPSKKTVEHEKFEKAAEHREQIKKEKKPKKDDD